MVIAIYLEAEDFEAMKKVGAVQPWPQTWAQCNSSISPTVGGCELGGLRSSSPSQGQVHRGASEVDLDLDEGDLS